MTDKIPASLLDAVKLLEKGGGVAYPTETCWGLGVRADKPDAVDFLLKVKGRRSNQPISLMIPAVDWLFRLGVVIEREHEKLIKAFWPGALTLLFKIKSESPYAHLAAPLLGVRCTSYPLAQKLITALDIPLTSPSANLTGQPLISDESGIRKVFEPEGILVLDDDRQSKALTESTVMKIENGSPVILREGVIKQTQILSALNQ